MKEEGDPGCQARCPALAVDGVLAVADVHRAMLPAKKYSKHVKRVACG